MAQFPHKDRPTPPIFASSKRKEEASGFLRERTTGRRLRERRCSNDVRRNKSMNGKGDTVPHCTSRICL
jgi:hypothetical protein